MQTPEPFFPNNAEGWIKVVSFLGAVIGAVWALLKRDLRAGLKSQLGLLWNRIDEHKMKQDGATLACSKTDERVDQHEKQLALQTQELMRMNEETGKLQGTIKAASDAQAVARLEQSEANAAIRERLARIEEKVDVGTGTNSELARVLRAFMEKLKAS